MANDKALRAFENTVWDYYQQHGRHDLLWRIPEADGTFDAYKILISEVMLQQTQVPRVQPKFTEFIQTFPNVKVLAEAPLASVLAAWNGLGYNRRAKYLSLTAQTIMREFGGLVPEDLGELQKLPGIGPNTAGAIMVYAYNRPVLFIETNIRTAIIYHYFKNQNHVPDQAVLSFVERTLDRKSPRSWYYALVDYGSYLKAEVGNLNRLSTAYVKQSKFAGSKRQLRGQVIRMLLEGPRTVQDLGLIVNDVRLKFVVDDLVHDGLVCESNQVYSLSA